MSSVVGWSEIYPEIIDLIMKRLGLVEFIRAGAVCQSWRSAMKSCYTCRPKSHTPWLILSSPHQPESRYVRNPADPKYSCKFNIPNMKYHFIIGSSHGFIISVDKIAQVHATNPITGSHRLLPAITTLPCGNVTTYIDREFSSSDAAYDFRVYHLQKYVYGKVALFPTSSASLICVLIRNFMNQLAFARQSDESWTLIGSAEYSLNFEDVLFYKGLLYAVNRRGKLFAFDILNFSAFYQPVIHQGGLADDAGTSTAKKYLVQSPCGSDLFLIARFKLLTRLEDDDSDVPDQTVGFKIYKLNQDSYQWSQVSSFGTDPVVVFLGFNPSVILLAKDIPNVAVDKGDCIYFTDDCEQLYSVRHKRQKLHDMGIFYMEDKTIAPLDIADDNLQQFNYPLPFWFTPSINREN